MWRFLSVIGFLALVGVGALVGGAVERRETARILRDGIAIEAKIKSVDEVFGKQSSSPYAGAPLQAKVHLLRPEGAPADFPETFDISAAFSHRVGLALLRNNVMQDNLLRPVEAPTLTLKHLAGKSTYLAIGDVETNERRDGRGAFYFGAALLVLPILTGLLYVVGRVRKRNAKATAG